MHSELRTGHVGHPAADRGVEQVVRGQAGRDDPPPDEQPASGIVDLDNPRQMLADGGTQSRAPPSVDGRQGRQVRVVPALPAEELKQGVLRQRGGMQVRPELRAAYRVHERGRHQHPADPQPRSERLGKGSDRDDSITIGGNRWHGISPEAQCRVRLVLGHQEPVPLGQLRELPPPGIGERGPGRIMEGRDRVDEFGTLAAGQPFGERADIQAVVVNRDRQELRLVHLQAVQGTREDGLVNGYKIPGVEQGTRDDVQALQPTGGHHDLARVDRAPTVHRRPVRDPGAQRGKALSRRVLQRGRRCLRGRHLVHGRTDLRRGQCLPGRQPTSERDDVTDLAEPQRVTHHPRPDLTHPPGERNRPRQDRLDRLAVAHPILHPSAGTPFGENYPGDGQP